jgi:hypothetical protein
MVATGFPLMSMGLPQIQILLVCQKKKLVNDLPLFAINIVVAKGFPLIQH